MSDNQTIYRLTGDEWTQHTDHRRVCNGGLCDHPAHHYSKAFASGRVLVDGRPVNEHGRRWRRVRQA